MKPYILLTEIRWLRYTNQRGGRNIAYSEAMLRAIKKYEAEKIDRISLRVPKGKKEIIQKFAEDHGESVNSFINRAIDEAMQEE